MSGERNLTIFVLREIQNNNENNNKNFKIIFRQRLKTVKLLLTANEITNH